MKSALRAIKTQRVRFEVALSASEFHLSLRERPASQGRQRASARRRTVDCANPRRLAIRRGQQNRVAGAGNAGNVDQEC